MGTRFWRAGLALLAAVVLSACGTAAAPQASPVPAAALATATPAPTVALRTTDAGVFVPPSVNCATRAPATPEQTEGPYYKANPPQRASLIEPGIPGERFIVTGYVLTTGCTPAPNARLDFWQADGNGAYDNSGTKLSGYQIADARGLFRLETVYPGLYPGRTRHIHVKVNAPNGPVLTTQLYFPNEPANKSDGIFNEALLTTLADTPGVKTAVFYFLLAP